MRYAITTNGGRAEAEPGITATCPTCSEVVIPKCGDVIQWHFAHKSNADCDTWSEGESAWHYGWKSLFPEAWREVVIGPHRADIHSPFGRTIELQHSSISSAEIQEREAFYGPRMVWIFDAQDAFEQGRLSTEQRTNLVLFNWQRSRATLEACSRRVFLDTGRGELLRVQKIHFGRTTHGWGTLVSVQSFVDSYLNDARIAELVNNTRSVGNA